MTITHQVGLWGFRILCLLVALAALRILFAPISLVMPAMAHYQLILPVPMYLHIIFGPISLFLLPFQFWHGLRQRKPRLHRAVGYGYFLSVIVSAIASLALLAQFLGSVSAAVGLFFLALLWIATTLRAVGLARQGKFAAHRVWMIRSAALTFGAVSLRLQLGALMAAGYDLPAAYDLLAWSAWVPNLLLVEYWLRKRQVA